MCLLVLAWNAHPRYRLVVAANRDEYHDRPAAPLARWPAPAGILAGRDLRAGGTWLGLDSRRRFGVVTNYRELARPPAQARSRGGLIPRYLGSPAGPGEYLAALESEAGSYGGFNLLLADGESLWYASNRSAPFAWQLPSGVHALANERLDTAWPTKSPGANSGRGSRPGGDEAGPASPKLRRVRHGFESWLGARSEAVEDLFALLGDRRPASQEEELPGALALARADLTEPGTGLSAEWERALSSPFVVHERYGTRCSTVAAIEPTGRCYLAERRFDPSGASSGESEYRLEAGEWP